MFDRLKQMLRKTPEAQAERELTPEKAGIPVSAYCTCTAAPVPPFPHHMMGDRAMPDSELAEHLRGFEGYVLSRGGAQMTRTKYHVIRHVQRVQRQFSFLLDPQRYESLWPWAEETNALIFLPDGHVRDPRGLVLVPAEGGEGDPDADIPYPPKAWQRKARTDALLDARGIHVPSHLPPLVSEPELRLRQPDEVVARAMALLAVAIRAESLTEGNPIPAAELLRNLAAARLTPKETAFIEQADPQKADIVQFSWRYECVFLLQWALGLAAKLPFPGQICDVPRTAEAFFSAPRQAAAEASLREPAEILDALDLHHRLHWHVRQAGLDQRPLAQGLEGGVVRERHHALNWLVRFENHDWDQVQTPT